MTELAKVQNVCEYSTLLSSGKLLFNSRSRYAHMQPFVVSQDSACSSHGP